jgi:F-type H+-transporting ATPase subunit b
MHIDWFVFAAQIINFLILAALLKFLLYDRIVKAMDERQARIASSLDEADRLKDEARAQALELDEKNREALLKAEEILSQAAKDAQAERQRLLAVVRQEAEESRQRWRDSLLREREVFFEGLRLKAGAFIFGTVRRIIDDMADEDLEERMCRIFIARVGALDEAGQDLLRRSLDSGNTSVTIRSAFELGEDRQKRILDALGPYLLPEVTVSWEVSPAVGAGIELMSGGYKLSWSMGDYLAGLEEEFRRALKEEIPPGEAAGEPQQ